MRTPPFESTIDGYTVGVIDASMAMMSAVTAAESLGLGCCCVGYVRTADPRRISDMLGLPEGVSIVCGLTIGYPREMPDLKPKLPVEAVVHEGRDMPDEEAGSAAGDIPPASRRVQPQPDRPLDTDNDWAGHIADYHRHSMEHGIGEYLEKQIRAGEIDPDRLLGAARRNELQTASSAVFGMQDRDLDFAVSSSVSRPLAVGHIPASHPARDFVV